MIEEIAFTEQIVNIIEQKQRFRKNSQNQKSPAGSHKKEIYADNGSSHHLSPD